MSDLYWLTDEQMDCLRPYFPKSHGEPRIDDRRVLSGIVFVSRNGLRWRDAPKEYGPHKTLYNRWKRWGDMGVLPRMMEGLAAEPVEIIAGDLLPDTCHSLQATYFQPFDFVARESGLPTPPIPYDVRAQRGAAHENILGVKPPIFLLTNPPAADISAGKVRGKRAYRTSQGNRWQDLGNCEPAARSISPAAISACHAAHGRAAPSRLRA